MTRRSLLVAVLMSVGLVQAPKRTVWDGVFSEEQAARGQAQYTRSCASCHAADLRGSSTAPSLVEESFAFQWGDTSVGELFDRIRVLMPSDRPNSLSPQTYRDIVAFILQSNQFPTGAKDLDADVESLKQIAITAKGRSQIEQAKLAGYHHHHRAQAEDADRVESG